MKTLAPALTAAAWKQHVQSLEDQISAWSQSQGWTVVLTDTWTKEDLRERRSSPALRVLEITTPEGRLMLESDFNDEAGVGHIKFYAWPTHYRVRLIPDDSFTSWKVMTDSGIPWHNEWNQQTFVLLATDLLKANQA